MTDKEKLTFILNLLAKLKIELNGAKEAFSFTEAYCYLIKLQKELDDKNANK